LRKFLAQTVEHCELFSKEALAERKRRAARRDDLEWLGGYLKTAWEPTTQDLQDMADSIGTAEAKWKQSYKPIKDKVFAHHDLGVSMTCSAARWSATSRTSCTTSTGYGRQYSSYLRTGGSTG
jgi:hypothetical protein